MVKVGAIIYDKEPTKQVAPKSMVVQYQDDWRNFFSWTYFHIQRVGQYEDNYLHRQGLKT